MKLDDIEGLKTKYQPIIQGIVDRNKLFYQFETDISWDFFSRR